MATGEGGPIVMNELKDLSRYTLRLRPDATLDLIDAVKRKLLAEIDGSVKGVVLDCHETKQLSLESLSMLYQLKSHAESEKKRFCFTRVHPGVQELIDEHSGTFKFDVFGLPSAKRSRKHRESAQQRAKRERREKLVAAAKRAGLLLLVLLPIVGVVEYFLVTGSSGSTPVIVKSFEPGEVGAVDASSGQVVIRGTVNAMIDGRLVPDKGATVTIWTAYSDPPESPQESTSAWLTTVDQSGSFQIEIPLDSAADQANATVLITSQIARPDKSFLSGVVGQSDNEQNSPQRRSNVYQYVIKPDQPLRVDTVFR